MHGRAQVRVPNLAIEHAMAITTRSLRFRRPRVQHAIRVAMLLRRAIARRRLRYASASPSPVTLATFFQPRNFVLQGVSLGNVRLEVRLSEHDMNHVSGDFLFAIAEHANRLIEERVVTMRSSGGGA